MDKEADGKWERGGRIYARVGGLMFVLLSVPAFLFSIWAGAFILSWGVLVVVLSYKMKRIWPARTARHK